MGNTGVKTQDQKEYLGPLMEGLIFYEGSKIVEISGSLMDSTGQSFYWVKGFTEVRQYKPVQFLKHILLTPDIFRNLFEGFEEIDGEFYRRGYAVKFTDKICPPYFSAVLIHHELGEIHLKNFRHLTDLQRFLAGDGINHKIKDSVL